MGCGFTTVKYLLFFFNLIFALCGLAVLVAAALSYSNVDVIQNALKDVNLSAPPVALIVLASIVFIIAFYGCCGAIRESHCMVVTFAVLLLVILIAEIAIGIVIFVNRGAFTEAADSGFKSIFEEYKHNNNSTMINDINAIQTNLECCGLDGPTYWSGMKLPSSCCKPESGVCNNPNDDKHVYQEGCLKKAQDLIKAIGVILGAIAVAVGAVEIIGVVFALCLANSIRNRERRGRV